MNSNVIFFSAFLALLLRSGYCCVEKFQNFDKIQNASQDCAGQNGITLAAENYENPEFDDKGVAMCILKKMELITETGNLDKDEFMEMLEEAAPKKFVTKLTEIVDKCSEKSGVQQLEGVEKSEATVKLWKFYSCFYAGANKLC